MTTKTTTATEPEPEPMPQSQTDPPNPAPDMGNRMLQITLSHDDHVRLAKLCTRWTEKGIRPSLTTKSALISAAIQTLAAMEGV